MILPRGIVVLAIVAILSVALNLFLAGNQLGHQFRGPGSPPNFEQHSNQIRTLVGYGDQNRHGWNVTLGASYDFVQEAFQNQIVEVAYNGSCCGVGFEYRRFSFGTIRNENQFSVVFRIANLGSAGNLRRQEKIF